MPVENTADSGVRRPLSSPASAISGLTVDPGGPPPSTLRLNSGREGAVDLADERREVAVGVDDFAALIDGPVVHPQVHR